MAKNLFNASIKYFQSDGGTEYVNHSFSVLLHHLGIQHRLSCPHTPQQNGLAERKHRHIANMTRTLLAAASAPLTLWVEAALTSVHLINLLPISTLQWSTPYTFLFGRPPIYSHLRTFGYMCFPYLGPYVHDKLMPRSIKCVFVGYSATHKGYRCLDRATGRVYISRHVVFNEEVFLFANPLGHQPPAYVELDIHPVVARSPRSPLPVPATITPVVSPISAGPSTHHDTGLRLPPSAAQSPPPPLTAQSQPQPHVSLSHPMVTRSKAGTRKPKTWNDGSIRYHLPHALSVSLLADEPTCFTQANRKPE